MNKMKKIIIILTVMFSFAYAGSALNNEEAVMNSGNNEVIPVIENTGFISEVPVFKQVPCSNVFDVCDTVFPNDFGLFDACMVVNGC